MSACAIIALTAGCATPRTEPLAPPTPPRQFVNWPPLLDEFRFHWSAAPGIDITTGPALIARAYLESYEIAWSTFNPEDVYRGFTRAVPESPPREGNYLVQLVDLRPLSIPYSPTPADAVPQFGYEVLHFLELTPVGDGYRAIVCSGNYANFIESETHPGKFHAVDVDDRAGFPIPRGDSSVRVHRIEFTQHDPRVGPNPPAPMTTPQKGPAPAPDQDVFGNWLITAASNNFWGPILDVQSILSWPPDDLKRRCADAMPEDEAQRRELTTGWKDAPPPHGAAVPGWPVDAH